MLKQPIILFDGVCNYCNSMVNFIIRQDKKKIFRFANTCNPMPGKKYYSSGKLTGGMNLKLLLLLDKGRLYDRSTAVLKI